jgi:hypothetical protein
VVRPPEFGNDRVPVRAELTYDKQRRPINAPGVPHLGASPQLQGAGR